MYRGKVKCINTMNSYENIQEVTFKEGEVYEFLVYKETKMKLYSFNRMVIKHNNQWIGVSRFDSDNPLYKKWFEIIEKNSIDEKVCYAMLNNDVLLNIQEVLKSPYGTKFILDGGSDFIYEMRQSLVILNDTEIGVETPALTLELLNSKFKLIR